MEKQETEQWQPHRVQTTATTNVSRPPDTAHEPMEFLSRSWSSSALELSKALAPPPHFPLSRIRTSNAGGGGGGASAATAAAILEDLAGEVEEITAAFSGNPFSFASSETSQLIMERIMSQSQEVSPRTSGRLSHSSGPLTDSPPVSPPENDELKFCRSNNPLNGLRPSATTGGPTTAGSSKTVGRWLKDRKEKKKEESRAHNAQRHAAISVAGVASAIAAIAASTAASSASRKDEHTAKTDMAVASAATLVAAQCVEAAESMGADHDHLASVLSSAVNVQSAGDIVTLTAAAATALRGVATLKARALKDVWNIAAVTPVEKSVGTGGNGSNGSSNSSNSGEHLPEDNFSGICSNKLLARGYELLKRTRKGDLHWKIVCLYINRANQVTLKMKSRHVAGTITKKKKNVVVGVIKDMPAWPGRHLLEDGEHRCYFGLKTLHRGVVEFECRNQREYDLWTQGVTRLLSIAAQRKNRRGA